MPGRRRALLPIFEALSLAVRALGPDAELDPRKTYVSLMRGRLFGMIQASTRTRVDLGLRLPGHAETPRLRHLKTETAQATHIVALVSPDEVDDEVKGWLREAYEGVGRRG